MAGVEVTITGMLYDKLNRTQQNVVIIGEATLTGLGIGGGPIYPPEQPPTKPPRPPTGIWPGPGDPDLPGRPVDPGYGVPLPPDFKPPGIWGPNDPRPTPPIVIPPEQVPPGLQPPTPPPAGTTTPVPPPAGSAGWPVQPIAQPAYVVMSYPGYGPIYVTAPAAPPAPTQPAR